MMVRKQQQQQPNFIEGTDECHCLIIKKKLNINLGINEILIYFLMFALK